MNNKKIVMVEIAGKGGICHYTYNLAQALANIKPRVNADTRRSNADTRRFNLRKSVCNMRESALTNIQSYSGAMEIDSVTMPVVDVN